MKYNTIVHSFKRFALITLLTSTALLAGCANPSPNIFIPNTPPPPALPKKPPQIILALGGGGAKGFALAGAIQVLEKAHIPIDMIVGTSAGSIIGALYADHPNADDLMSLIMNTKRSDIMSFSFSHPDMGFIHGYRLQNYLLQHMQAQSFKQLKIPFIAVATDYQTGKAYPLLSGPIAPAVNASAAVPGLFFPVYMYGKVLVDGGLSEPVPVITARKYHPKLIIAINISDQPPKKIPYGFFSNLMRTYNLTANNLTELQLKNANVVLYPDVGEVGIVDGSQRARILKAGQLVAEKALPIIEALMKAKGIKPETNNLPTPPRQR